jgi:ABC-type dipeptide/oligopeptide/nickel transport system permease component
VAGVCIITFIISHLIPGDPARLLAGDRASDEIVQSIRQQLGWINRSISSLVAMWMPLYTVIWDLYPHWSPGSGRFKSLLPGHP